MSNIANNIVAHDKKLSQVFTDNRYHIDVFQRDYRWQYRHVDALISDLASNFMTNYMDGHTLEDVAQYDCYYMGPIVVCDDQGGLSVVDGQQRLTTFSLLFIYLTHLQRERNIVGDKEHDMANYLYVRRCGRKSFTLDVPTREKMMKDLLTYGSHVPLSSSPEEEIKDSASVNNLKERYDDICQLFPHDLKQEHILPLFIEWLLYKVIMVEIHAYSTDNAYTIFETMNDRGLNLNQTEILKAYILSKISNETQSEEMNEFWRSRVADIKHITENEEADLAFFRAWLRAKYAMTIRQGQSSGAELEDFEQIGSHFTNWFKTKSKEMGLKSPTDYYFFIKGDFDFFSSMYIETNRLQRLENVQDDTSIFITACYPMADSLYMPLILSPLMLRDTHDEIKEKMHLVNQFADVFINRRTLAERSVNQSTIRRRIFEITKSIRNTDVINLQDILTKEAYKLEMSNTIPMQVGFSQNYMHYILARFKYYLSPDLQFSSLLRSRKRSSLLLCQIFSEDEWNSYHLNDTGCSCWSLVNYCLCHRQYANFSQINPDERLLWLVNNQYIPEMANDAHLPIAEFFAKRYLEMNELVNKIWSLQIGR